MNENAINNRRKWKAEVFPYDDFIPDSSQECQYCLTEKQAELLRGLVTPLAWDTRWWSDTSEIDKNAIQEFRDDIIRRLMMSCCGDENPILYRYTNDGILQQSTDDGVTWTDAPLKDPRNYSPQFPPIPGTDNASKRCLAATGMVAIIKSQVGDQLTDDMSHYTLSQLITDWVKTMINSSNPFEAILTIAVNQIFALVISALRPALTDTVYSTLKCILYCNMSNNASISQSQVDAIRGEINDQIGGIAGVFLEHLVYLLGQVGMTNLARASGATSGDCSDCPSCNPCDDVNFLTSMGGFTTSSDSVGTRGEWVSGQGWVQTYHDNVLENNRLYIISPDISGCDFAAIRVHVTVDTAYAGGALYYGINITKYFNPSEDFTTQDITVTGSGTTYEILFTGGHGDNTSYTIKMTSVACDYRITAITYE